MGILGALFRAESIGLSGQVIFAVLPMDILADGRQSIRGDARRIGSHIGDQTDGTLVSQLNSFIELLRQLHRAPGLKSELTRRFLLQLARHERRRRIAPALFLLDFGNHPSGVL